MYSTRFNGCPENKGDHERRRRKRELNNINTLYYIHLVTHLEGDDHKVVPFLKKKTHVRQNRPDASTR
jgi:hypothetical protein